MGLATLAVIVFNVGYPFMASRACAEGDRLLMEVGARLLDNMRPADTVARLGGDEFAILLETVGDVQQAERVAARVVAALDRAAHLGGYALPVRASLGLALSHCGEVSSEELMRQADVAMYRAKGEGKGRWVIYDRSMESDSGLAAIHGGLLDSRVG